MASSGSANEDFQSRVDRIFGSLAFSRSSTPSSPAASRQQLGSVWSLSDTEVEKREWKREQLTSYDRDDIPCASSLDDLSRQQRTSQKPCDGEDGVAAEDFDEDGWSIRASMGLDRTLDDEAEEDEYDKVALGKEDVSEGLLMEDVVSRSSIGRIRDPRANYVAAQIRLKEDELEAKKISGSVVPDHPPESKEPPQSEESSKAVPPKPILKRKENSSDSEARSSKRVSFDGVSEETSKKPEYTCSASASFKSVSFVVKTGVRVPSSSFDSPCEMNENSQTQEYMGKTGAQVPDYLLNPSKYARYSFDPSCDENEKSPTQEDMDIPKAVEELETSESESLKKVCFIPQKKTKDVREQ